MELDNTSISGASPTASAQGEPIEQQIFTAIRSLAAEVAALQDTVAGRLSYDQEKETAFDYLYAELEAVKQERAFEQVRPLFIDLMLLFDRVESCRQEMIDSASASPAFAQILQTIGDELLEVLSRREVEILTITSPVFDREVQQVVGTRPASSEAANNQVVRVVRRGFRYRNRIIRPEQVIVSKYPSPGNS